MRSLGIVTLLSVVATAAAPWPAPSKPASFVTAKSSESFIDCFAKSQDRRSAAWWFVPKATGGTFSNAGAAQVARPYFLVVSDRGHHREILLQDPPTGGSQLEGVSQCI
jgi:hypothetical protein